VAQRNYLVEGVSCTGKSAVCRELRRRGYSAVDGDNELAYRGDPETGEPTESFGHPFHVWDVGRVKEIAASRSPEVTFFCGGSRNFAGFIDVFDEVLCSTSTSRPWCAGSTNARQTTSAEHPRNET
jgi:hypothetical protein